MALRAGHGMGRGRPRIERLPIDELPSGHRAELTDEQIDTLRRELRRELRRLDGITSSQETEAFRPFIRMARQWREAHALYLAVHIGGGVIGPGALAMLSSATLQLANSRYLQEKALRTNNDQLVIAASRLADQHRQNMLAVHELVAREALLREDAARRPKKTIEETLADEHKAPALPPAAG